MKCRSVMLPPAQDCSGLETFVLSGQRFSGACVESPSIHRKFISVSSIMIGIQSARVHWHYNFGCSSPFTVLAS